MIAPQQFSIFQKDVKLGEHPDFSTADTPDEMVGAKLAGMLEAGLFAVVL